MSGLEPEHPAAGTAFDGAGRSIHLYPTERAAKLECLKLALGHGSRLDEAVERAGEFADFVLGGASEATEPPIASQGDFARGNPLADAFKAAPGYGPGQQAGASKHDAAAVAKAKAPERSVLSDAERSLLLERVGTILKRLSVLGEGSDDIRREQVKLLDEYNKISRDLGEDPSA